MRKPNIYLTKKVRRNLELKARKAESGAKVFSGKRKKHNAKVERKAQLRALKAKKRAERQERKQQHKSK